VQNQIEGAGVSTISMTVQPHITGSVGVPRAVFIRFPAGNQLGEAGKPQQQRAILTAALEAVASIQRPGTIVELPYRWRRFPVEETPKFIGASQGPRHPQAEAVGAALDTLVRLANEYKSYLEERLAREIASPAPIPGLANALRTQISRVERLVQILDTDALDALRETVNGIATLELRASGKFV
jgi:D-proline reductase (dithiol) PrdB